MSKKVHVFNAGPCLLPQVAIDNTIEALKDFAGTGISVISVALVLAVSCNKVNSDVPGGNTPAAEEQITISATLSDVQTKVDFGVSYDSNNKPAGSVALTWAAGDKIRVYDHADRTRYEDFELDAASVGQKKGEFTGTAISASSYKTSPDNRTSGFCK